MRNFETGETVHHQNRRIPGKGLRRAVAVTALLAAACSGGGDTQDITPAGLADDLSKHFSCEVQDASTSRTLVLLREQGDDPVLRHDPDQWRFKVPLQVTTEDTIADGHIGDAAVWTSGPGVEYTVTPDASGEESGTLQGILRPDRYLQDVLDGQYNLLVGTDEDTGPRTATIKYGLTATWNEGSESADFEVLCGTVDMVVSDEFGVIIGAIRPAEAPAVRVVPPA